jgi:hypothetical protein
VGSVVVEHTENSTKDVDDETVRALSFVIALTLAVPSARAGSPVAPPKLKNGQRRMVVLAGRREEAICLQPAADGWHVLLATGEAGNYSIEDVTPGAAAGHVDLVPVHGELVLDAGRFRPDHAYHLRHRGANGSATTLYLVPDRARAGHVDFAAEEHGDGAEIDIASKGAL